MTARARRRHPALPAGPFAGVPTLLKDMRAGAVGMPTRSGSRMMPAIPADHDSTLVARFRAAGLIPMGKTNVPEFGILPTTESALYGACAQSLESRPLDRRLVGRLGGGSGSRHRAAGACHRWRRLDPHSGLLQRACRPQGQPRARDARPRRLRQHARPQRRQCRQPQRARHRRGARSPSRRPITAIPISRCRPKPPISTAIGPQTEAPAHRHVDDGRRRRAHPSGCRSRRAPCREALREPRPHASRRRCPRASPGTSTTAFLTLVGRGHRLWRREPVAADRRQALDRCARRHHPVAL